MMRERHEFNPSPSVYIPECAQSLCWIWLFATPWTVARQASLPVGLIQARILKWVAMPCSRGIFSTQELNHSLLHWRWILYQLSYQGSPYSWIRHCNIYSFELRAEGSFQLLLTPLTFLLQYINSSLLHPPVIPGVFITPLVIGPCVEARDHQESWSESMARQGPGFFPFF